MTHSCPCPYCGAVECCRHCHPDSVCQQPQGQVVGLLADKIAARLKAAPPAGRDPAVR